MAKKSIKESLAGKMTLTTAFDLYEIEFNKIWQHYVELHKQLDTYRGMEITELNVESINKIVGDLQDTFILLYPSLKFIQDRGVMAKQAIQEYTKFMDDLKATGAQPETVDVKTHNRIEEAQA